MYIKIIRGKNTAKAVEGQLYINNIFECYTLEDTDRQLEKGGVKIQDRTAIPKGIYTVVWNHSNHFNKDMPQILNVPQFEGVRIHGGNSDKDTEGCILVGAINNSDSDDWISSSQVAVSKLYPKIQKAFLAGEKITLEIV